MTLPEGTRGYLLAPIVRDRKGEYRKEFLSSQDGLSAGQGDGRFTSSKKPRAG